MRYVVAAETDVGNVKTTNQDSVCVKVAKTAAGQVLLAVLCDGMGGLQKGEVASAEGVKALADWFVKKAPTFGTVVNWDEIEEEWGSMIHQLNESLLAFGEKWNISLGTTLTAILICGDEYFIGHVGDSRIYKISKEVTQLTQDQTVVAREIKRGRLTMEEAKTDPRRHVLLQCVGASNEVVPEFTRGRMESDTMYLLCSDGFRQEISEEEIFEKLNPNTAFDRQHMNEHARELIERIKERGERDNITVAMIRAFD